MTERQTVQHLDLATATGLWRIEGASGTSYTVDADSRLALRQPAPDAATGPYDGCWMHLIGVASTKEADVIRVGRRHRWDLDPAPGEPGFTIWWIQTEVTAIIALGPSVRPTGHPLSVNEDARTFEC